MSEHTLIEFINCRLLRNHALVHDNLWIRNGKIINPEPVFFDEKREADIRIDCQGALIAPGYIDIQINGGFGVDFAYDTKSVASGLQRVANELVCYGVTSFCPTLVTSPPETYSAVLPHIRKTASGANVLGVHLEGPFINTLKKGAHVQEHIRVLDKGVISLFQTYGSLDNVKIITLAPEKDTSGVVTKYLTQQGITVALGHSEAHLGDGEIAVHNGARLITHLFNAMLPFHHRDPGLFGLLASCAIPSDECIYFSIIADGVHTHPAALRIAYRTNPDGLILVTDAISAFGLEDGVHHIGEFEIEVRKGSAYIAGTETLCGSIIPLDECVRNLKASTDCSIVYAIETATLHPAKCLRIDDSKGTLNFGADADFIMLDDNLNVLSTWINGKKVYSASIRQNCGCNLNLI